MSAPPHAIPKPPAGLTETRQRIDQLRQALGQVETDMVAVADEFKQVFRAPWPVHLSVQKLKTGATYLRWRRSGKKGQQPYLQLASVVGQKLLRDQSPVVLRQYSRFHHRLLALNLGHSLCLGELRRLEHYIEQLRVLQGVKSAMEK